MSDKQNLIDFQTLPREQQETLKRVYADEEEKQKQLIEALDDEAKNRDEMRQDRKAAKAFRIHHALVMTFEVFAICICAIKYLSN